MKSYVDFPVFYTHSAFLMRIRLFCTLQLYPHLTVRASSQPFSVGQKCRPRAQAPTWVRTHTPRRTCPRGDSGSRYKSVPCAAVGRGNPDRERAGSLCHGRRYAVPLGQWLKHQILVSHNFTGWRAKMKQLAGPVPSEVSLPVCRHRPLPVLRPFVPPCVPVTSPRPTRTTVTPDPCHHTRTQSPL